MKDITLPARLAMVDKNPDSREAKLRRVRRRLFPEDANDENNVNVASRDGIERQFAEELSRHQEEKKKIWNFDFENERPLEGTYEWERAGNSNDQEQSSGNASQKNAPENADANAQRTGADALRQAPSNPSARCD